MTTPTDEKPLYRATVDLHPSPNSRHRHEMPFSDFSDPSVWQQTDRPVKRGEIVSTTDWPHSTMMPLNDVGKRIHSYFEIAMKSRLPMSPFQNGRLVLDDGIGGPTQPKFNIKTAGEAA
jgi:hypothetical protein